MKRATLSLAVLALLLAWSGKARADILFSNLGPGGTYATEAQGDSWAVEGSSLTIETAIAASFTPTATGVLSDIKLPIFFFGSGLINPVTNSSVVINLQADNNGAPGSVLESWNASNLPVYDSSSGSQPLTVETSSLNLTLSAGTQYWVSVLPGNTDTDANWAVNPFQLMGLDGSNDGGSTWYPVTNAPPDYTPAFEVDSATSVTATPEPSTLVMVGMAAGTFAGYSGWRRKRPAKA